ncbi:MAG: hypothetical protein AA908_01945 [Chlorobi bacterium NICIL-2]|nr:MAG: hypothetical protein AA908_01945 [Chlorobi bacterium NICIL-2]
MVLIIPAIELRNGQCRRCVQGPAGTEEYYTQFQRHPERMAQLLRQENARSLHVVDLDGLESGIPSEENARAIERIVDAVDIPIEYFSVFGTADECERWLQRGVFRLVISELIVTHPEEARRLVQRYTPSRIVLGIRARNRIVRLGGEMLRDVDLALRAKALGLRRVIYSDIEWEGTYQGPDFEVITRFAQDVRMSITIAGGIDSPQELWRCNTLRSVGVDSVIVGRALAENRFPCQHIWRQVESLLEKKSGGWQKKS